MTLTWKLEDRRTYRTMQKSSLIWVSKRYIKLSQNLVLTLNKGDKLFLFSFTTDNLEQLKLILVFFTRK